MTTHSSILAWRIPTDRGAWQGTVQRVAESDTAERLSTHAYPGMGLLGLVVVLVFGF